MEGISTEGVGGSWIGVGEVSSDLTGCSVVVCGCSLSSAGVELEEETSCSVICCVVSLCVNDGRTSKQNVSSGKEKKQTVDIW